MTLSTLGDPPTKWQWLQLFLPRSLPLQSVTGWLQQLAADASLGTFVVESRRDGESSTFLIATRPDQVKRITHLAHSSLPDVMVTPFAGIRTAPIYAGRIEITATSTGAGMSEVESAACAMTRALHTVHDDEEAILQVLCGERLSRHAFVSSITPPCRSFWDFLAQRSAVASAPTQNRFFGFRVAVRLGVAAASRERAVEIINGVLASLRLTQPDGHVRIVSEPAVRLTAVQRPRGGVLFLDAGTLPAMLGWPIGDPTPGSAHQSRLLAPRSPLAKTSRVFAETSTPGVPTPIGVSEIDARMHLLFLGPTGTGKTECMLRLALHDITEGRGVLWLDPKGDVDRLLERIPEGRIRDVIIVDPSDGEAVVGFQPLRGNASAEQTADSLLAVLRRVWVDSWGVRSEEVLAPALVALCRTPGTTLLHLPQLLLDEEYRDQLLMRLEPDPLGVDLFFKRYGEMPRGAQATLIGPAFSKLQEFYLRPGLRAVLGQASPKLDLRDLFDGKVIIFDLNPGRVGEAVSRLLGALVFGTFWPLAMERSKLPASERSTVHIYADEIQNWLALPNLSDALDMGRGLGVSLTAGHQHRAQLSEELRAAFDTNMRSKVLFSLNDPDATLYASRMDGIEAEDLRSLPKHHVYTNVMENGEASGWLSGRTQPLGPPLRDAETVRALSRSSYGVPAKQIEDEVLRTLGLRGDDRRHLSQPAPAFS
jgi:hypothetical protein